eukprot:gene17815-biopygen7697
MERLATGWRVPILADATIHADVGAGWVCRLREQVVYPKRGNENPMLLWQIVGERKIVTQTTAMHRTALDKEEGRPPADSAGVPCRSTLISIVFFAPPHPTLHPPLLILRLKPMLTFQSQGTPFLNTVTHNSSDFAKLVSERRGYRERLDMGGPQRADAAMDRRPRKLVHPLNRSRLRDDLPLPDNLPKQHRIFIPTLRVHDLLTETADPACPDISVNGRVSEDRYPPPCCQPLHHNNERTHPADDHAQGAH